MPLPLNLNPTQRRHLYEGFVHLDRQLRDVESLLRGEAPPPLFPRYRHDLSESERDQTRAAVARVRSELTTVMAEVEVAPEPATLSTRQAVRSQLALAEIGLEELDARAMRNYGPLASDAAEALTVLAARLKSVLTGVLTAGPAESAPAPASRELADELEDALDDILAAQAQALAAAVLRGADNDELPLVAGDELTRIVRARLAPRLGVPPERLPAVEIVAIRWRLDKPRFGAGSAEALRQRFRKQMASLESEIRATLRDYAIRVAARPSR